MRPGHWVLASQGRLRGVASPYFFVRTLPLAPPTACYDAGCDPGSPQPPARDGPPVKLPVTRRQAASLRRRLLAHYDTHRRPLPWRASRDPYRVLVAEVMLQQTTVAAVIPYYQRFLARFPDARRLASARQEEVLRHWAGLGYYRRARSLHQACREVVQSHNGRFPADPQELERLPGIGAYTAGAVASIAFGRGVPAVDGNVERVLSRLAAVRGRDAAARRRLREAARSLVDGPRPGDVNQALMDLGATLCAPRAPACADCPLRRSCAARDEGRPEMYPAPRRRPAAEARRGWSLLVQVKEGVLLVRRPPGGILAGLWELPGLPGDGGKPPAGGLAAALQEAERRIGRRLRPGRLVAEVRHSVLNRVIRMEVREAGLASAPWRPPRREGLRLLRPGDAPPALTAAARKGLEAAGILPRRRGPEGRPDTKMRRVAATAAG